MSRNLEKPRVETDGRFARAIRLAEADGVYRQELEAKYENIWTAFWWFDDFQFLNGSYDSFERLALDSDHSINLEFLSNVNQLLVNSVIHNHMTREECKLDERRTRLREKLQKIAADKSRPNNALSARFLLITMRMNQLRLDDKYDELDSLWDDFSKTLEKARGLGEFNANRLVEMVELAGNMVGNDPTYNDLVDKTADFISERKSEAEGALILLKRAQKLDFDNNLEMIRILGKATLWLTKKEYTDHLIEALQLLMLAYKSAGLLWAARASCASLAASLVIEGEEESEIPITFIPTMKIWAWIALELNHIPDLLYAIQMLNGALETLSLADESKEKVSEDIRELDMALGCLFLNLEEKNLINLASLPDILEALGLFSSRSALLYALGHVDTMRADGSIPDSESDENVHQLFSMLASQPIADSFCDTLILNGETQQTFSTKILGMSIEISIPGNILSIIVAEGVLSSLEVYFSTAIEQRIAPHTEKLHLRIQESTKASKPSFEINTVDFTGIILWPVDLSPSSFENQSVIHRFWAELSGHILATCCVIADLKQFLEDLHTDEAVQHRMTMVAVGSTSYNRVTARSISRISDWQEAIQKKYEMRSVRPKLTRIPLKEKDKKHSPQTGIPSLPKNHRSYSVKSVIDIHAWDRAQWGAQDMHNIIRRSPLCIALMFENKESGRQIFERWIDRFGKQDKNEEISLSIIRHLPGQNEFHYCVLITSKLTESISSSANQVFTMATRSLIMTPDSHVNLERFLESYGQIEAFYISPAFLTPSGKLDVAFDLSILKRELTIKNASDIGEHDVESIALRKKIIKNDWDRCREGIPGTVYLIQTIKQETYYGQAVDVQRWASNKRQNKYEHSNSLHNDIYWNFLFSLLPLF